MPVLRWKVWVPEWEGGLGHGGRGCRAGGGGVGGDDRPQPSKQKATTVNTKKPLWRLQGADQHCSRPPLPPPRHPLPTDMPPARDGLPRSQALPPASPFPSHLHSSPPRELRTVACSPSPPPPKALWQPPCAGAQRWGGGGVGSGRWRSGLRPRGGTAPAVLMVEGDLGAGLAWRRPRRRLWCAWHEWRLASVGIPTTAPSRHNRDADSPPSRSTLPGFHPIRRLRQTPPPPVPVARDIPTGGSKAGGSGRHGGHRRWPPHQATAPKSTAVQWAHAGNARWRCGIGGCARAVAPAASARGPQAFRRTAPPTHVPAEAAVGSAPPARPPAPNGATWVVRVVKPRSGRALTAPEKECGGSPR